MGSAVSCQTFERFSCALRWILQTHFQVLKITHYLDDYIFVGSSDDSSCLNSLLSFENLAQDIGIPLNEGKRCPPSTSQIVYGIEIDTTTMQLRLPAEKLTKAISLVDTMVNCRKEFVEEFIILDRFVVTLLPGGVSGSKFPTLLNQFIVWRDSPALPCYATL